MPLVSVTRDDLLGFIEKPHRPWDPVARSCQIVAPRDC